MTRDTWSKLNRALDTYWINLYSCWVSAVKTRFNAPFISYIAISMAIYVVLWLLLLLLLFLLGCFLRSLAVAHTYRMMANAGKFFFHVLQIDLKCYEMPTWKDKSYWFLWYWGGGVELWILMRWNCECWQIIP